MTAADERIKTGVRNLDQILSGGVPVNSLVVVAGTPGAGKTILSQQIIFRNATPEKRALIFHTLSEPTAKTMKFLRQFSYYDPRLLENEGVQFVDLGSIVRSQSLEEAVALFMKHVKRVNPAFVIIDSFKVFEDLARSREELRKFSYEVAVQLMAWECTSFLLGEFNQEDIETNPLFSIVDGILKLTVVEESGEQQRFLQAVKLRGTDHSRDRHPFSISSSGIEIYAPRVTIRRDPSADLHYTDNGPVRVKTRIRALDALLGEGIPSGSSLLISGVAGTGKTLLSLEFIYRGAKELGEKGIFVSFEETEERLRADAKGMGWDLDGEIERGTVELICIPQTDILVEKHLLLIHERIERLKAKRVAIDSVSIFLYKVVDPRIAREKLFQLATLVQKARAVGFLATDIPYGSGKISRFGVEETLVDGVVFLTTEERGLGRERFLEVYKLRNAQHESGRYAMTIGPGGITLAPVRPHGTKARQAKDRMSGGRRQK